MGYAAPMVHPFRAPGESEDDASARFSQEAVEATPEWMSKDAAVIEIHHGTGSLVSFARGTSEDGKAVWRESQSMRPSQPIKGAVDLAPEKLLEMLRGPLGA
jgi:hypothetical protein